MNTTNFDMEGSIARCRVFLSVIATVALYLDPHGGGAFALDRFWATVLAAHFLYSVALLEAHRRRPSAVMATVAMVGDVLFAAAVATVTEGTASPFYSFFAFAVLTAGLRSGLRLALAVTSVSVALYVALVTAMAPPGQALYLGMRAAYIAITGYLIGYFGEQRIKQDAVIRKLEADAQREQIARSLHDGYAQALAGINLRLETSRELLRRGRQEEALAELTDLQVGVNREHDELRAYIRSLIELDAPRAATATEQGPTVVVRSEFRGSATFVEHALLIMLEGLRNARRHAQASLTQIEARMEDGEVLLTIDDDGVGFRDADAPPWSIVSRVAECGGALSLPRDDRTGAHLRILLPVA